MLKNLSLLGMLALAAAPLSAQSAKEVADSLAVPAVLEPGMPKLPLPEAPPGVTIEFGGADFEQILDKEGRRGLPVLADTPVLVYFRVTKNGQTVDSRDYPVLVKPTTPAPTAGKTNPKPATLPAILQWAGDQGEWKPGQKVRVFNDALADAEAFCRELRRVLPDGVKVGLVKSTKQADIILSSHSGLSLGSPEAYRMSVTPEKIGILAEASNGVYMGTRTLLQILTRQKAVPCGTAIDLPRYAVRGCVLDVARSPIPLQDLRDMVDLMAWYKMNDLQLLLSGNYAFLEHYTKAGRDPLKECYAAFRLESRVGGKDGTPLTARDLAYSKAEFRELIDYARARGVNIVPCINSPGNALPFARVRPDLIYRGPLRRYAERRDELLDAAKPETLRFITGVLDEYLQSDKRLGRPVFENCVVHIGGDDLSTPAGPYRKYVDGLLRHVLARGYTPRVHGALSAQKGPAPVVAQGVQMNIWSETSMPPQEAISQGYDIINTLDDISLIPYTAYFRVNYKAIYEKWRPNSMRKQQVPAGHPQLLGASFSVHHSMSDLCHTGYNMLDIREPIANALEAICGRLWGAQEQPTPFAKNRELASSLGYGPALAPPASAEPWNQVPTSPTLPLEMKQEAIRPPYHLILEGVRLDKATPGQEQALLSGPEGELLGAMKDGSIGFRRADGMEFAWQAKLPVGRPVRMEIIATPGNTRLIIDRVEAQHMTLNTWKSRDENFAPRSRNIRSTFSLPGRTLGKNFHGTIYSIDLKRTTPGEN